MTRDSAVRQTLERLARGNFQPKDIQEARIVYNIRGIQAFQAPSYHGKMRAVDVRDLQTYAATVRAAPRNEEESLSKYGASLAFQFAALLGIT